jgi:hypothetical protein
LCLILFAKFQTCILSGSTFASSSDASKSVAMR